MYVSKAKELITKYNAGLCTEQEKALLESWYPQQTRVLNEELSESKRAEDMQIIRRQLTREIDRPFMKKIRPVWYQIAAASAVILMLSIGTFMVLHPKNQPKVALMRPGTFKNDVLPGKKAILTLGNGQQLVLNSIPPGRIARTGIEKTEQGMLVYQGNEASADTYNTVTVPQGGGIYELKLADGTMVVLDAGSSIKFPVAFNGKDRRVSITGQVYFDVAHNARQPFYVTVSGQTIEDIGTHFNINAFDGQVSTTLLEGSIKIGSIILKPGQQAVQKPGRQLDILNSVDGVAVIAWKKGLFQFNKTSLNSVMQQISRWYDVEIVYQGPNRPYHFGGYLSRESKLTSVLKILQLNGVKFSLNGRKLIVYR